MDKGYISFHPLIHHSFIHSDFPRAIFQIGYPGALDGWRDGGRLFTPGEGEGEVDGGGGVGVGREGEGRESMIE